MDEAALRPLLSSVRTLARAAGRTIRAVTLEAADVTEKEDGSPLTRADLAASEVIGEGLRRIDPPLPIVCEEDDGDEARRDCRTFWLVDPLDGTKEFIRGLDEYTVNIALIEETRPVLGVIYAPAMDVLYYAAAGCGAWKVDKGSLPQPLAPSDCPKPARAVVSRSHLDDATRAFLERMGIEEVLQHGSSLKICAVADASADIYPRFGPTWLWDTGAGAAIATEAGCEIVDLAGQPLNYDPAVAMKHYGFIVHPAGMAIDLR